MWLLVEPVRSRLHYTLASPPLSYVKNPVSNLVPLKLSEFDDVLSRSAPRCGFARWGVVPHILRRGGPSCGAYHKPKTYLQNQSIHG